MNHFEQQLLNNFQRDLPLVPKPFAHIAEQLGVSEEQVITALLALQTEGVVSRVGPVFTPRRVGASTLAAMAVPEQHLTAVAQQVSDYLEVNHNYQREHHYNLWFVATAASQEQLNTVLAEIEQQTGLPVMRLPLIADYHIDLAFNLQPQ